MVKMRHSGPTLNQAGSLLASNQH